MNERHQLRTVQNEPYLRTSIGWLIGEMAGAVLDYGGLVFSTQHSFPNPGLVEEPAHGTLTSVDTLRWLARTVD